MLKHVIMWKLKDEDKEAVMDKLESGIKEVAKVCPQLLSLEVGRNFNTSDMAYDMVLIMEFESEETLASYLSHPKHKEFSAYCKSVRTARTVVDYFVS